MKGKKEYPPVAQTVHLASFGPVIIATALSVTCFIHNNLYVL